MSLEENKAIVRGVIEAENKHNPALMDEFIALDFVSDPDTPAEVRGLESLKQIYTQYYKGFPDLIGTIEDIIAEGDEVWVRYTGTGTHTGEFMGIAPTGKKVTLKAFCIYRIVDTKVVEWRQVVDMLDFYKKLGVIEYTETGKKLFPEDVK